MSKVELDIHENSLDNSADGELLGMVNEGSFESTEDKAHLVAQSYLEADEEDGTTAFSFKELSGPVTYRFVPVTPAEDGMNTITSDSPTPGGQFYVISNPVEMYRAPVTQKKIIHGDPIVATKKRDEKRRATHNEVERRRRDKINNWITKLARLVPDSGAPDSASKGGILAKACDYITELTEKQKRYQKMERENDKLIKEVFKLNQELSELRKENTSLMNQLSDYCIANAHKPKPSKP